MIHAQRSLNLLKEGNRRYVQQPKFTELEGSKPNPLRLLLPVQIHAFP